MNKTAIDITKRFCEADMKAKYKVVYYIDCKLHEFETVIELDNKVNEAEVYSQIMPKVKDNYKDTYEVDSFAERKGFSEIVVDFLGPC